MENEPRGSPGESSVPLNHPPPGSGRFSTLESIDRPGTAMGWSGPDLTIGVGMNERTERQWQVRLIAYFLLAVAVAIVTPTPDAISMVQYWLPAIVLFEVGYFIYRRYR